MTNGGEAIQVNTQGNSTSNLLGLRVLGAADTRIVHHKCTIEYAIKD